MIDVNALRKGTTFTHDGELFKVLEFTHNKTGRGGATIRTKVVNLRTGAIYEKTFTGGERVETSAWITPRLNTSTTMASCITLWIPKPTSSRLSTPISSAILSPISRGHEG